MIALMMPRLSRFFFSSKKSTISKVKIKEREEREIKLTIVEKKRRLNTYHILILTKKKAAKLLSHRIAARVVSRSVNIRVSIAIVIIVVVVIGIAVFVVAVIAIVRVVVVLALGSVS